MYCLPTVCQELASLPQMFAVLRTQCLVASVSFAVAFEGRKKHLALANPNLDIYSLFT